MDRNTKQAAKPRLATTIRVAKSVYVPLRDSRRPYLDDDELKGLKITRKPLDLFSDGKPHDGAEQFIEPIEPHVMGEWLRIAQGECKDLSPRCSDATFFQDNHMEAVFLHLLILRHLGESNDKDGFGPDVLRVRTHWTELT